MKKKSVQSIIFAAVVCIHLVFILTLCLKAPLTPSKKQHKPMLVKTIVPTANSIEKKVSFTPISHTSSKLKPSPAVKKPSPPAPPKMSTEKKLPEKKENLNMKKPVSSGHKASVKKIQPLVQPTDPFNTLSPAILRELEESIAKIEDKNDKNRKAKNSDHKKTLLAPSVLQIDSLQDLKEESVIDSSDYASTLTRHLHASLHLPDFGEVKIELTLKQDGTIAKLRILKTESEQNKKYLESVLPQLKLPHLTGSIAKQDEHTFVLNFCNEL